MEEDFQLILLAKDRMEEIIPLVTLLNNNSIPAPLLRDRLIPMLANGYQCLGVYHKGQLIGISGFWILHKFYVGKHVEPDNVFIMPEYRSSGVGKLMIDWIISYARSIDCTVSEVNCYIKNERGKQFWMNQGYEAIGYHMQKVL
ncbi:MAG: GNAT family N-acetyltransferase [Sediminicola sp.]